MLLQPYPKPVRTCHICNTTQQALIAKKAGNLTPDPQTLNKTSAHMPQLQLNAAEELIAKKAFLYLKP
jgi:hypothetical protein